MFLSIFYHLCISTHPRFLKTTCSGELKVNERFQDIENSEFLIEPVRQTWDLSNILHCRNFKICFICTVNQYISNQISILVQARLIHMRLLIRNGVKVNCIFMKRARLALILALKWNPNYVHGLDYVSPWWIIHVIQLKILAQTFGKHNTKVMLTLMDGSLPSWKTKMYFKWKRAFIRGVYAWKWK